MQQTIERINRLMAPMLNDEQASELHTVLVACLTEKGRNPRGPETMTECIDLFLAAKKLEGCSERSFALLCGHIVPLRYGNLQAGSRHHHRRYSRLSHTIFA